MASVRRPFQGVWNIIRFNWHFYLLALVLILILVNPFLVGAWQLYAMVFACLIFFSTLFSLIVSFYVYDLSDFYELDWLDDLGIVRKKNILNVNAGFDETSELLHSRFPRAELLVYDFYDPELHTEVSIKRARAMYPPYPGTVAVSTSDLPAESNSFDQIYLIFAAHEIRSFDERQQFFIELCRSLKPDGQIVLVEHLRDLPNFMAYHIGCFHFMTKASWERIFKGSGLVIRKEQKLTPFVSVFLLEKYGTTS